jgi:hypothetical protein
MNNVYQKLVGLLLDALPEVAKEDCFALHGGTAINLFVRNIPRLQSVKKTLAGINDAVIRIKGRIESLRSSIRVRHKSQICKLQIDDRES